MAWSSFQSQAYDLTAAEIESLARGMLNQYTDARKEIEAELRSFYMDNLDGVKKEDYYKTAIVQNNLDKLLARVNEIYNARSVRAGQLVAQGSSVGFSNTYYRGSYADEWLAPDLETGILPAALVTLVVFGGAKAVKGVSESIQRIYGSTNWYASKAGALRVLLKSNRKAEVNVLQGIINRGMLQGLSFTDLNREIRSTIGTDIIKEGKLKVTGNKAVTMQRMRTEANRSMNAGNFAAAQFAESKGVNIQRQLVSTLDDRTRAQSASMDGQIRAVDKPFSYPGGVTAMYPGTTGINEYDINDREQVFNIIDEKSMQTRTGTDPTTGETEKFGYKNFSTWAKEKGLKKNRYGEIVAK